MLEQGQERRGQETERFAAIVLCYKGPGKPL